MDHMGILKKSWSITWRYRALWLLGIFAGVTGPSFGGSSGSSGGSSGTTTGGSGTPTPAEFGSQLSRIVTQALPFLIVAAAVLIVVGFVWWVLGIAARGGLVKAVDGIEEGRGATAGSAWAGGFENWGRVFTLELLLGLPVLVILTVGLLLVGGPIVAALAAGQEPGAEVLGGVCGGAGVLLLAVPIGVVTGALAIVGTRYAVLDGLGATAAIGAAWGALRSRFKDTALMWLVNLAVNAVLGIAVGIPMAIVAVIFILPAVGFGAVMESWEAAAGTIAVMIVVLALVGMFVNGVWGTFTSAMWTIWWRRLTGREQVAAPAPAYAAAPAAPGHLPPPPAYAPPPPPAESGYTAAPAPPAPPAGDA